jgi:Lrp/AsnC family leucine-responsive transcriptional regulator
MPIDRTEQLILEALQQQGRMPNVELAELVGLSESPTFRRVKALEKAGFIERYAAIVDQRKLGLDVTAYVAVSMEKQPDSAIEKFHDCVNAEPHIVECHAMSGANDYLMKVVARNIDHFSEICMQRILKFPGVRHVESNFALSEIKRARALPIDR